MSGTSASSLLDILRGKGSQGTSPATSVKSPSTPAPASVAPAVASTTARTPSPGHPSLYSTAPNSTLSSGHTSAAEQDNPSNSNGDLDRLFRSAFSTHHPSSTPPVHTPTSSHSNGTTTEMAYHQGVIERPPPPPAASQAGQSASLLSLLQQMGGSGGKAPSVGTEQVEQQMGETSAAQTKGKENGAAAAQDLLKALMGGSAPKKEAKVAPQVEQREEDALAAKGEGLASSNGDAEVAAPAPTPPQFAPFVSTFDLLAQAHAKEKAEEDAAAGQVQLQQTTTGHPSRAPSALPSHLAAASAAIKSTASSDSGDKATRSNSAPAVSLDTPSSSTPPRHLLASQHLSSANSTAGLQLPTSQLSSPQTLTIDLSLPQHDSLSPTPAQLQPVTLFSVPPSWCTNSSPSRRVGIWSRGLVYATPSGKGTGKGKGRIRVIEREKGGRVLLKGGHAGEVEGVEVARGGEGGWRMVASSGGEGRVCLWSVREDGGVGEGEIHRLLLAIQGHQVGLGPRFQLVRLHPQFQSKPVMAVALNDGRVFVLDLSSVLEQEGGKTVEGDETLLYSLGKGAQCGAPIVDVSFSPDGSVFVVLTSDHGYAIRSTAAPTEIILSGKLPSSTPARGPAALSGISFLAAPNAHPTALVITSLRGTVVHLVPLHRGAGAETSSTISLVLSSSSTTAPSSHFSHHAYHQPSQTLYLSSSLRGSFFALRLSLAPLASVGTEDDATFFATAASEGAESQVKIQHVVEVSTGEPVLGFVLDDSVGEEAETMGALVLHPNGVHQVMFERPRLVAVDGGPEEGIGEDVQGEQEEEKSEEEREEKEQGQGMVGLESSILVSSEVAVAIDEADPVAATLLGEEVGAAVGDEEAPAVSEDTVAERKSSITPPPVVEEAAPSVAIPESTTPLAPLASPTRSGDIKLSGSAVNAAIRSMKKHKDKSTSAAGGSASPTRERGVKQEEPPSSLAQAHTHAVPALIAGQATSASAPTATKGTNDAVANAWATGVAPAGKKGSKKDELHAEVLRELKKVEEGLPGKVAAVVKGEMEKYAQRAEEDKINEQAADAARQATMLKLVSTTLSKSTGRLVEAAIKEQIKSQVIPGIGKLVSAAVQEQIGRGIEEGLKETLPNEVAKILYRPDLTSHLARHFSSAISPSLDRSLTSIVANGVIPAFNQSLNGAVEQCMLAVRREMVDVRKEVVKEQGEAVLELEEEVRGLRGELSEMRGAMERMERMLAGIERGASRASAAAVASPRSGVQPAVLSPRQAQLQHQQQSPQRALRHAQQQQQQQAPYPLVPIPRAQTPPQAYEDMFTSALQPDQEPTFPSLMHLIKSSPPSRQDAVFPPAPQQPKISPPVILSLAYRLSQVIAASEAPVDDEARRQLGWVRRCLTAMDGKSPQVAEVTPRILEMVITSLHGRCKHLHALEDRRGMEETRTVEQYARAQLRIFSETGGKEAFRR